MGRVRPAIQPMIERDFYGRVPAGVISPPNLGKASYSSAAQDEIVLEFDQPVLWHEGWQCSSTWTTRAAW